VRRKRSGVVLGGVALLATLVVFVVPFAFILLTAAKDPKDAAQLGFTWPQQFQFVQNFIDVVKARDYILVIAYINSIVLTVASVTLLVVLGALVAYVMQRRPNRLAKFVNVLVLAGLVIPPAVVPTVWLLQKIGLFGTMPGLILVEVAFGMAFSILLFRAFIGSIPREIDEAAFIDGAGPLRVFFRVILPLLRPVMATVVVVQSVAIFNDFQNPLYFLPGDQNATLQLTLFNFQSQFNTNYNLLFMDILLITIPPLLIYVFFNRQIVAGMTSGAVKG
jgi:raffinose/stachyose/melibiose transport system permease protein